MSLYDAVSHSFTTVSTGGFSPHDASMAHFDSAVIEWIAIAAMFIAGSSFTLIYRLLKGKPKGFFYSGEFRLYSTVVVGAIAVIYLTAGPTVSGWEGLRDSAFSVTAITSTTGFGTTDFGQWQDSAQSILLLLMPLGAMAGSTAGGVKLIRVLAVASFARREVMRQVHPGLVRSTRIGRTNLDDQVTNRVVGFLVLTLGLFGFGALYTALAGADMVTALSVSATSIGNVGPGLGDISPAFNFLNVPRSARWVSMVLMLLGRLEIYPILLAVSAIPLRIRRSRRLKSWGAS
jgi:trk system potassium uptake protein TrkH